MQVDAPEHILQPLHAGCQAIKKHAIHFGGNDMPRTCGGKAILREDIEISVDILGKCIRIVYARATQAGSELDNSPLIFTACFFGKWAVSFGTAPNPSDAELTERLGSITAS
jgi:hypothetical protein